MNGYKSQLLIVKSNLFGEGEPDLGEKLIISFFKQLLGSGNIPDKIIFMNSGIFLTTENSPIIEILKEFEIKGSKISSCGTCLNYYHRENKLATGTVGNMKDTVDAMQKYDKLMYV
jgi:selenium metabolism protein YedF